jgi:hypothetical protein
MIRRPPKRGETWVPWLRPRSRVLVHWVRDDLDQCPGVPYVAWTEGTTSACFPVRYFMLRHRRVVA